MPGIREDWFPTSIWYFQVEEHERLNADLLALIEAEHQRDARGMTDRSSILGWHSAIDLHVRPEFAPLMKIVLHNALEVAGFQRWDLAHGDLLLLNCWANINGKFASNATHNHPNSLLSGAYYVQAAEGCGNIIFRDPRDLATMFTPPLAELTPWTFQTVRYQPIPGRMLIFPSWLYHSVEPNLSDQERIVMSFNLGFRPR